MTTLVALSGEHRVGVIVRERAGPLTLVYDEAWRRRRTASPISVSMPLAARELFRTFGLWVAR